MLVGFRLYVFLYDSESPGKKKDQTKHPTELKLWLLKEHTPLT